MNASILIRQKIPIQQIIFDRIQETLLLSHYGLQKHRGELYSADYRVPLFVTSSQQPPSRVVIIECRTSCKLRNYWRRASTHATSECVMPFADSHRANLTKRRQFTTRLFLFLPRWVPNGQLHEATYPLNQPIGHNVMLCQFPRMGSFIPPFRSWKSSSWLPFPPLLLLLIQYKSR